MIAGDQAQVPPAVYWIIRRPARSNEAIADGELPMSRPGAGAPPPTAPTASAVGSAERSPRATSTESTGTTSPAPRADA